MIRIVLLRLAQAVPLLFLISLLVFLIAKLVPGDPIANALAGQLSSEAIEQIRHVYGLDKPAAVQYLLWLKNLFSGDWGTSLTLRAPVIEVLSSAFANTAILTGAAVLLCLIPGVAVGVTCGLLQGTRRDRLVMLLVQLGHNIPIFWLAVFFIWLFAVKLRWFPVSGMYDMRGDRGLGDLLHHLFLPALSTALISMLILARQVRHSVIDIMNADYIRTYRALGYPTVLLLWRHLGRNLLAPIVSITGLQIGYLLSGVIFIEKIFAWPGIGTQLYNAAAGQDYPTIQTGVMLIAVCFLAVNLLSDILQDWLDPRHEGAR
ncbi:ABC transporter permease [Klebsiella variicola]|uniref:ABC transporter permease n=1 Tax=Klebsiella variicola TaxID=244366 RepID=UPI0009BBF984|nr:ABC transporter permease [Klebsiella variicola]HCI5734986.1 ABC transporter permease [Klebsiella variicola subsp. variicola]HCI6876731.1 ABC transporter permease [Klebsiella quasipneumoniae subsp. similipneumoniae]HDS7031035.1 ABC transporter permease [Klebsiella pneumoniae subsp. pneumoniae]SLP37599.1 dipeptide transport system permease DppB [Klebsiella variicola]SXG02897.1 dipeptide transport system permease DppB [Klebsiella variicola]